MEDKNVYDRARQVVRELVPLLHTIREHDKSLADQLKRAAQSVVLNIAEARGNDWGYIETHRATHLDEVCAITWCLSRRL
jgi:four helix bundle protein